MNKYVLNKRQFEQIMNMTSISDEAIITANERGLSIHTIEPAHVCMSTINIPIDSMGSSVVSDEVRILVSLYELKSIKTNLIRHADVVVIWIDESKLKIKIIEKIGGHSNSEWTFELPVENAKNHYITKCSVEHGVAVDINRTNLERLVKMFKAQYADAIGFIAKDEDVTLVAYYRDTSTKTKANYTLGDTTIHKLNVKTNVVGALYSPEYLLPLMGCYKGVSKICLVFDTDIPMKIQAMDNGDTEIESYIAPMIIDNYMGDRKTWIESSVI